LVSIAIISYDDENYENAILCINKVIKLLKLFQLEEKDIFFKNHQIFVKNIQFKFLCRDKIREKELRSMIETARKVYNKGKTGQSLGLLFELPGMRGGVEKGFRNKKINDFL